MASFQWPQRWLMTDPRLGPRLAALAEQMPRGSGIVLRDPDHAEAAEIARICHARGIILAVARDSHRAEVLGAALVHTPGPGKVALPFSLAVHDEAEAEAARQRGAALVFISPIHATRSHPGAAPLGEDRADRLARLCDCPAIALGGMNEHNFSRVKSRGFSGWAGIDAWLD